MNRIEICGGISSGKTTLAELMEGSNVGIVFENFKQNPFWKAFYAYPGKYTFETETTFTLLHYHQLKKQIEKGINLTVCDFSFSLDLAYARIGLIGSQLSAFETVCSQVYKELGLPSLLIYLKCEAETELSRIGRRNRTEEISIKVDFLERLNKAVEQEVSILQSGCPVLTIDSSIKDFANDEQTKEEMRDLIRRQVQELISS